MGRYFDNQRVVGIAGGGGAQRHQFGQKLSRFERAGSVEFGIGRLAFGIRAEFGGGRDYCNLRGGRVLCDVDIEAALYQVGDSL